jgi:hypothetical protein
MSDVAFFLPASPITGRGAAAAAGGVDAGRGGSIGGCGGLSWSGGGCCAAVIGTGRCLWRGRGVAERQRRAIQFLIPEIASGRTQLRYVVT